jgi:protein-disulfide isomerase
MASHPNQSLSEATARPDWAGRVLVACAVAITCLAAVRVLRPEGPPTSGRGAPPAPVAVKNWQALVGEGRRTGPSDAKVVVIEFVDFECPVCRVFAGVLDSARTRYRDTVAVELIHFPLTAIHPYAMPAARAAECAAAQGRFGEFVSALFAHQRSLGAKPWSEFAVQAGVRDVGMFNACEADTTVVPRIARGLALGDSLKLTGTPMLIINGWRFAGSLGTARLDSVIRSIIDGSKP